MALSTPRDEAPPIGAVYAALSLEWMRQLRAYTRSVRLYQRAVMNRRAERTPEYSSRPGLLRSTSYETVTGVPAQRLQIVDVVEDAPPSVVALQLGTDQSTHVPRRPLLTRRQLEIAELIAQGLTNAQIADQLVVSRGTVGNHIGHMLRRLGVHNRAQIAAWMIRHSTNAG
jgi:DNA-binding CsgD family transcriptional regulator